MVCVMLIGSEQSTGKPELLQLPGTRLFDTRYLPSVQSRTYRITGARQRSDGSPIRWWKERRSRMIEREVTIKNKYGLHTRPASLLVKVASRFKANFYIYKDGMEINGKSIIGV